MVRWVFIGRAWLVPCLAMVLWAPVSLGAEANLHLQSPELQAGQTGVLQLSVIGLGQVNPPDLPVPDGLQIAFAGTSQKFTSMNFKMTQEVVFRYQVTALREGQYTLGPYSMKLQDGSTLSVNGVSLNVVPRPDGEGEDVVVQSYFEPSEVYEGQVVLYHYEMRVRQSISGIDFRPPEFKGVRSPLYGDPVRQNYTIDDPKGSIVVLQGSIPLIATKVGEHKHSAGMGVIQVSVGRRSFPGFQQVRNEQIPGQPATLTVLSRPQSEDLDTLLVGDFVLRATVDKTQPRVGDSVTWTVEMLGEGILDGYGLKWPQNIEGARVYRNEPVFTSGVRDGKYRSLGVYEGVVVPTQTGRVVLPPMSVRFFSPQAGTVVEKSTRKLVLNVSKGTDEIMEVESFSEIISPEQSPESILGLRPIYVEGSSRSLLSVLVMWVLTLLLFIPGMYYTVGRVLLGKIKEWSRRVEAEKQPEATPQDLLASLSANVDERLAQLDRILHLAMARHLGEDVEMLNRGEGVALLKPPHGESVQQWFEQLDRARFADGACSEALLAGIQEAVTALEETK